MLPIIWHRAKTLRPQHQTDSRCDNAARSIDIKRHYIIAVIIAPILSILAWLAVGKVAGEKPQPAQAGHSYPLLAGSNCRYSSGVCDLQNGEIEISLSYVGADDGGALQLRSSHNLSRAVIGIGLAGATPQAAAMMSDPAVAKQWSLPLSIRPSMSQRIYLAVTVASSQYFGEASTQFLQPMHEPPK